MNKKSRIRKLLCEALENRTLLASDWQNPGQTLDVNHDLVVSPLDALLGINRINSKAERIFPLRAPGSIEPYYDVDGNGASNPLDILLVINALNSRKPIVNVELLKDTGMGVGANADRITSDISVRGAISFGVTSANTSQLWGRIDNESNWHDFTLFVAANQSFSIPQSELVKAFGSALNDGAHTLRFQARYGSNHDQLGAEADLPVLLDTSSLELNIAKQSNSPSTIIVSSPSVIEVPLGERASPATLLTSKIKLFDATFDKLQTGSVEITPRGVSLSSDGRTLLVEPPDNTDSTKYLIAVGEGAVEDTAGNKNSAFDAFANQYSQSTSSLMVWNKLTIATAFERRVAEYTFNLSSPDLFILNGLRATSSAQVELFAPSGKSVLSWAFDSGGTLAFTLGNSAMLSEFGEYRLRVALPKVSEVFFSAALASQLPEVPSDLHVTGNVVWGESHSYALTVTDSNRFYFKSNLVNPVFFTISVLDINGKQVQVSQVGWDAVFEVARPGRYAVLITPSALAKFDFSIFPSKTIETQITPGQYYEQSFDTPGQRALFYFPTTASHTYTLESVSDYSQNELFNPNYYQSGGSYGQGLVSYTFNRTDVPSAKSRFRVVETQSTFQTPVHETIHVEPLQQGLTRHKFNVPFESYEFTFDAQANDLYAALFVGNQDLYTLIAPTGSQIYANESGQDLKIFRIPYAGQYRLRVTGVVGIDFEFQWQKLSQASPLVDSGDVHFEFQDVWFAAYKFTAKDPRFFAYAINAGDTTGARLIDADGKVVGRLSEFNTELDLPIEVGEKYTLIVQKRNVPNQVKLDFHRTTPISNTQAAAIGETVSGTLAERGDRQVIELDLTAGQLIQLTSNLDPSKARVRWLDAQASAIFGIQNIDPALPDRIAASRIHHVEIQNLSSAPVNYSLKFNSVSPPVSAPVQLIGFNEIRSGTVGNTPQIFEFGVSAGAMYLFDWLLPETFDVSVELKDAAGKVVPSLTHGADSFQIAESAGTIRLTLSNSGATPKLFSFRMLSPDATEGVVVGVEKAASVIPFGTAIFRIPLANTTELFLDAKTSGDGNTTWLYRKSAATGPAGFEYINGLGQFFDGEGVVWAANNSAEPYNTKFTVRDVTRLPLLALDTATTFSSEFNRNYIIPFQTTAPVTVSAQSRYDIMDQDGNFLERDNSFANAVYHLNVPGLYRAIVAGDSDSTTFKLHTQVVTEKVAKVGEVASGEIANIGDIHRYRVNLVAGTPLVFGMESGEGRNAQWIAPDGEIVSTFQIESWGLLPVYLTGEYRLEVFASSSQVSYTIQLTDLSQLAPVTGSNQSGITTPGLPSIFRISGLPHQLLELQVTSDANFMIVDRLGNRLSDRELFSQQLLEMPNDGDAFLFIWPQQIHQSANYSFTSNLVDLRPSLPTIGQPILGSLPAKWAGKSYSFHVDEPTWLRVAAQGSNELMIGLTLPDGTSRSVRSEMFNLVLPGDYQVQIYNQSQQSINFWLVIYLLDQTPVLPVDQWISVKSDSSYRLEIPESGRYELQLRDDNNRSAPTSVIRVLKTLGGYIPFDKDSRGTLQKDSYWATFLSEYSGFSSAYSLRVVPIKTTQSTLTAGQLAEFKLDPSGTQEYLVRMPLALGSRYLIDQLGTDGNVSLLTRRESDPFESWVPVDRFLIPSGDGTDVLLFRISGTGSVRLRIVDLNAAATLTLNTSASASLDATVRANAWRIDGAVGDRIEFINDSLTDKSVTWMIVDEAMNVIVQNSNRPLSLSIVNRQRFALVILANTKLDSALTLPFHSELHR